MVEARRSSMAEMGMASPYAENMISVELATWLLRGGQEGKIKTSDGGDERSQCPKVSACW